MARPGSAGRGGAKRGNAEPGKAEQRMERGVSDQLLECGNPRLGATASGSATRRRVGLRKAMPGCAAQGDAEHGRVGQGRAAMEGGG